MQDPYLPIKWQCSVHKVQPDLKVVAFDKDGFLYIEGDCPSDGHPVAITINDEEYQSLKVQAMKLIRKVFPNIDPITEDEIVDFIDNLDQMGGWEEE